MTQWTPSGCGNQHHTYGTKSSVRVWESTPHLHHKELCQGLGMNIIFTTWRTPLGCGNQHHTYNTKSSVRVWESTPYLQHGALCQGVGVNTILTTWSTLSGCGSQHHTYNMEHSVRVWESTTYLRHEELPPVWESMLYWLHRTLLDSVKGSVKVLESMPYMPYIRHREHCNVRQGVGSNMHTTHIAFFLFMLSTKRCSLL